MTQGKWIERTWEKIASHILKDRLIYNNALVIISLHSSLIEIPSNLACCGKILSLVIPGIELISRKYALSPIKINSLLVKPLHS